jgi:carbon-monoxide dehydrogenase small subunit
MALPLTVNGEQRMSHRDPMTPLLDVLRDEFQLTGTKDVCREGFCGACTVILGERTVVACLTPAGLAAGQPIFTIEGQGRPDQLSALQNALEQADVVQCGMCFPGMVMTLTHFLAVNPAPDRDQVKAALSGNICRCTGYEQIVDAVCALAAGA